MGMKSAFEFTCEIPVKSIQIYMLLQVNRLLSHVPVTTSPHVNLTAFGNKKQAPQMKRALGLKMCGLKVVKNDQN